MSRNAITGYFSIFSFSHILLNRDDKLDQKFWFVDEFCKDGKLGNKIHCNLKKALQYNSMKNIFSKREQREFLGQYPSHIKY
jgi:hypothetical protein